MPIYYKVAQALGKRLNIPVLSGHLEKPENVQGNAQLKNINDPVERANALTNIKISSQESISGKNVLLLDDIYRSGDTLNACCDVLRQHSNVSKIEVLTMTKTGKN